jgi:hypothetical protein
MLFLHSSPDHLAEAVLGVMFFGIAALIEVAAPAPATALFVLQTAGSIRHGQHCTTKDLRRAAYISPTMGLPLSVFVQEALMSSPKLLHLYPGAIGEFFLR